MRRGEVRGLCHWTEDDWGGQIYVHFMNACWSNQNHESASTEETGEKEKEGGKNKGL